MTFQWPETVHSGVVKERRFLYSGLGWKLWNIVTGERHEAGPL